MKKADYLIIGQGLAGSCLALELIGRGKQILVMDRVDPHSASRVAAGMFNPITSKVRSTTWKAELLFPHLHQFYSSAEQLTGGKFYYPLPMYRPFSSIDDQKGWDIFESKFLKKLHLKSVYGQMVYDPLGGLELSHSGFLDTHSFVDSVNYYLNLRGCITPAFKELNVNENFLEHCNLLADRVVFCEGSHVVKNPYFNWLPISKLKGEVLELDADLPTDIIFNRSVYLVPLGGKFKAGSTYDRSGQEGNSEAGIKDIQNRLSELLKVPFKTLAQDWGFRPVVRDRRPVIGQHPDRKGIYIFNGLGTKGVSLAPWVAECLSNWMESGESLPDELNISRFYPLYFKYLQDSQ